MICTENHYNRVSAEREMRDFRPVRDEMFIASQLKSFSPLESRKRLSRGSGFFNGRELL